MELNFFIYLAILGGIILVLENKSLFYYLFLPSSILFILIVRNLGYDTDIDWYSIYLSHLQPDFFPNINRTSIEFVFWDSGILLYKLFKDMDIVFAFLDMFWIMALVIATYNLQSISKNFNLSFYIVVFLSFMAFFGYENILRQFIASMFAIASISYALTSSKTKSIIFYFLAIFSHNVVIVTLPIFAYYFFKDKEQKIRFYIMLFLSIFIIALIIIAYLLHLRSPASTDSDSRIYYIIMFFAWSLVLYYLSNYEFSSYLANFPSSFYALVLSVSISWLDGDILLERISQIILFVLIFDIFRYSDNYSYQKRSVVRIGVFLIFCGAIFAFGSSMSFFDRSIS